MIPSSNSTLKYEQYTDEEPIPTKQLERDISSLELSQADERTDSVRQRENILQNSIRGIEILRSQQVQHITSEPSVSNT